MSGTTPLCLQQQFHNTTGEPLIGGLLYSMQAGTLNPQNAFRTAALTVGSEYPNPVILDASARVPLMFYADGLIRLILTDKNGIAQFDYDNVPVIGSSGGGGATDTTDVSRLYGTGDMKLKYGIGTLSGYVRGNKRTIGSSTSGATEFADATAQALFQYFWNTDANLPVFPSRGATAIADWTANKQIETPDFRGLTIGGLDGMGNSRVNRLTHPNWDVLGLAIGGGEAAPITEAQMPIHRHDVAITSISVSGGYSGGASVTVPGHDHAVPFSYVPPGAFGAALTGGSGFGFVQAGSTGTDAEPAVVASGSSSGSWSNAGGGGSGTISEANKGSGQPFGVVQPTRLVTVYFRL